MTLVGGMALVAAVSIGTGLGWFCAHEIQHNRATVIVDAQISAGDEFGLYYNNLWSEPEWQKVIAGQWHSYNFNIPSKLFMIRLDPLREPGAIARIRSIRFRGGNGETKSLDLSTLKLWIGNNFKVELDSTGLVTVLSTGKDTFLMGTVDVDIGSPKIPLLGQVRLDGISLMWSIVVSALLYVVLSAWQDWRRITLCSAVLGVSLILAAAMGRFVTKAVHFSPPAPNATVGHAAYFAASKRNDIAEVLTVLGACMLGALIGGWLIGGRRPLTVTTSREPELSPLWRSRFVWAGTICFGLLSFPQLHAVALSLTASPHPSDFDSQNIIMWEYLTWKGFLPYRDFWFPYSGFYNKLLPFPPDLMRDYLLTVTVFIIVFTCLYELLSRRWAATCGLCILFIALGNYGFLLPRGNWRYFLSLSLVLLAAVALVKLRTVYFVALGLWMGCVATQEISQLLYALLPVSALIAALLLLTERKIRAQLRPLVLWFVGTFSGFMLIWISVLVKNGQVRGWWGFVSTLGIQADYSAWPADVVHWFGVPATIDQFGIFFVAVLLAGGVLFLGASKKEIRVHSLVPLAIGCLAAMILQKQVVRPSITTQFIGIPLAGLGYLVLLLDLPEPGPRSAELLARRFIARIGAAFCAAGITSCFFIFADAARVHIQSNLRELAALPQNVSWLFSHQADWHRAEEAFFAPESIQLHEKSGVLLRAEFLEKTRLPGATAFVLGDSSFWYLLLDMPSPFYLSFFNQSPIFAQEETVKWLKRKQPQFVLWDPMDNQFDGVPNQVRVPLVFGYIAANYLPHTNVDKYLMLRRRGSNEMENLDFWRQSLGDSIALGAIPAMARVDASSEPAGTTTMMVVHIDKPVTMKERSVSLSVGPIPYSVRFFEFAEVHDYYVRLDRIPLVAAARINGLAPKLPSSGSQDCQVFLQTYKPDEDKLY